MEKIQECFHQKP